MENIQQLVATTGNISKKYKSYAHKHMFGKENKK